MNFVQQRNSSMETATAGLEVVGSLILLAPPLTFKLRMCTPGAVTSAQPEVQLESLSSRRAMKKNSPEFNAGCESGERISSGK
jgi:hypothetical protein